MAGWVEGIRRAHVEAVAVSVDADDDADFVVSVEIDADAAFVVAVALDSDADTDVVVAVGCDTVRLRDCDTARIRECETARLRDCNTATCIISDLRIWMIRNKQKINDAKTEF